MRIPVRIDTSMLASAKDSRNHLIQSIVTTPSTLVPASSRCLLLDDDVVQGAHPPTAPASTTRTQVAPPRRMSCPATASLSPLRTRRSALQPEISVGAMMLARTCAVSCALAIRCAGSPSAGGIAAAATRVSQKCSLKTYRTRCGSLLTGLAQNSGSELILTNA